MRRAPSPVIVLAALIVCFLAPAAARQAPGTTAPQTPAPTRKPDVIYVPTPPDVVEAMLKVARVGKDDVVYDLGCGDGRIVIAAAKLGARGVGIDIDPQRISEARENAKSAGAGDQVEFVEGDLFQTDLSPATVITLYLLPSLNQKLRPKLMAELRPGTRIVSHAFDMGDWKPEQQLEVGGRQIFYWTIPPRTALLRR